jgi:hypothetical protein
LPPAQPAQPEFEFDDDFDDEWDEKVESTLLVWLLWQDSQAAALSAWLHCLISSNLFPHCSH